MGNNEYQEDKFIQQIRETQGIFFDFCINQKIKHGAILIPFSSDPSKVSSDDSSKNNYHYLNKKEDNKIDGSGQVFEQFQHNQNENAYRTSTYQQKVQIYEQKYKNMLEIIQNLEQNYNRPDQKMLKKSLRQKEIEEINFSRSPNRKMINSPDQSIKKLRRQSSSLVTDQIVILKEQNPCMRQVTFYGKDSAFNKQDLENSKNQDSFSVYSKLNSAQKNIEQVKYYDLNFIQQDGEKTPNYQFKKIFNCFDKLPEEPNTCINIQKPYLNKQITIKWGRSLELQKQNILMHNKLNRKSDLQSDKYSIKSESSLDSDDEAQRGSKSDILRVKYMFTMMNNKQSIGGKQLFREQIIRNHNQLESYQNDFNSFTSSLKENDRDIMTLNNDGVKTPTLTDDQITPSNGNQYSTYLRSGQSSKVYQQIFMNFEQASSKVIQQMNQNQNFSKKSVKRTSQPFKLNYESTNLTIKKIETQQNNNKNLLKYDENFQQKFVKRNETFTLIASSNDIVDQVQINQNKNISQSKKVKSQISMLKFNDYDICLRRDKNSFKQYEDYEQKNSQENSYFYDIKQLKTQNYNSQNKRSKKKEIKQFKKFIHNFNEQMRNLKEFENGTLDELDKLFKSKEDQEEQVVIKKQQKGLIMLKRLAEHLKGHPIIENCFDEVEIQRAERENVSDIDATTTYGGAMLITNFKEASSNKEEFRFQEFTDVRKISSDMTPKNLDTKNTSDDILYHVCQKNVRLQNSAHKIQESQKNQKDCDDYSLSGLFFYKQQTCQNEKSKLPEISDNNTDKLFIINTNQNAFQQIDNPQIFNKQYNHPNNSLALSSDSLQIPINNFKNDKKLSQPGLKFFIQGQSNSITQLNQQIQQQMFRQQPQESLTFNPNFQFLTEEPIETNSQNQISSEANEMNRQQLNTGQNMTDYLSPQFAVVSSEQSNSNIFRFQTQSRIQLEEGISLKIQESLMDVDDESIKKSFTNPTQSEEELKVESRKPKRNPHYRDGSQNNFSLSIQPQLTENQPNIQERKIDQDETVSFNSQKYASNKKFQSSLQLKSPKSHNPSSKDFDIKEQHIGQWAQVQNESQNTVNKYGFSCMSEFSFKKSIIVRDKNLHDEVSVNIDKIANSSGNNEYSYRNILKDQHPGFNLVKSKISRGLQVSSQLKKADIGIQSFYLSQNNLNVNLLSDEQKQQIKNSDNSEQDTQEIKQKVISHELNLKKKLQELEESLNTKYSKQTSLNKKKGQNITSPKQLSIILPKNSHPSTNTSLSEQRLQKKLFQNKNICYPPHLDIKQFKAQSNIKTSLAENQTTFNYHTPLIHQKMKKADEIPQLKKNSSNWFDEDHRITQIQNPHKQIKQIQTFVQCQPNQFFHTQQNISENPKIYSPLFNRTVQKGSPFRQQLTGIDEDLDKLQYLIKKRNLKTNIENPSKSPKSQKYFQNQRTKNHLYTQIVEKEKDTSLYEALKDIPSDFYLTASVSKISKYKLSTSNSMINQKLGFSNKSSFSKGIQFNQDQQVILHLHNKQLKDKLNAQGFVFSPQNSPLRNKSNIGTESTFSQIKNFNTEFSQKSKVFLYSK